MKFDYILAIQYVSIHRSAILALLAIIKGTFVIFFFSAYADGQLY